MSHFASGGGEKEHWAIGWPVPAWPGEPGIRGGWSVILRALRSSKKAARHGGWQQPKNTVGRTVKLWYTERMKRADGLSERGDLQSTHTDSPLVQRPERPAGRPTEAPNHLHSQSAQQRILQEHVTRVASGEGSSARAVDLHQLQILPPRGGRRAAGAPASSSPPDRRCSPRRGLRRGQT